MIALVASPLAVVLIADQTVGVDWARLSDIGETYGAASAVLSGLAVVGVAISLIVQSRQLRVGQIQAMRVMQLELMRLLLEDPMLATISPTSLGVSREQWRREIYLNLLFKYLEMGYATKYVPEGSLREHIRDQFQVEGARVFWGRARPLWASNRSNNARRRFFDIVEAEYARHPQSEIEVVQPQAVEPQRRPTVPANAGVVLAGVALGLAGLRAVSIIRARRAGGRDG
ncbi:DUF6082 family protein [Micromonospora sp. CPCC 206061]|uniref:DUF6082 family protein n=1 Tax=Micromonospora sp. CPCC 206061 TaxID=3122410 RepID=UPI002FEFE739